MTLPPTARQEPRHLRRALRRMEWSTRCTPRGSRCNAPARSRRRERGSPESRRTWLVGRSRPRAAVRRARPPSPAAKVGGHFSMLDFANARSVVKGITYDTLYQSRDDEGGDRGVAPRAPLGNTDGPDLVGGSDPPSGAKAMLHEPSLGHRALFLAGGLALTACAGDPASLDGPGRPVADDLTCSIPLTQIVSGGPGKDGIPALTDPILVGAHEAGAGYLRDADLSRRPEGGGPPEHRLVARDREHAGRIVQRSGDALPADRVEPGVRPGSVVGGRVRRLRAPLPEQSAHVRPLER